MLLTGSSKSVGGKVQLINATDFAWKMKKSLGDKRKQLGAGTNGMPNHIDVLTKLYGDFKNDIRKTLAEVRTNVDPKRDQTKSFFVRYWTTGKMSARDRVTTRKRSLS